MGRHGVSKVSRWWLRGSFLYENLFILFNYFLILMHVDNELVEFVTAGEPEYEEIIEEYEEEILL